MASYVGHLTFSSGLGMAYGGAAAWYLGMDWGPACLGAGITALGGMLPDLDSQSGVPVRELFSISAAIVPCLFINGLQAHGLSTEQVLAVLIGLYLFIRYGVSSVFKRFTVHRGIYHSIPAMLISGLAVFLVYQSPNVYLRGYLALGVMVGFLSHLVLDELCSVDFSGAKIHLNQFAGSALKFTSPSWPVTLATYSLLAGLSWKAVQQLPASGRGDHGLPHKTMNILEGLPLWNK